MKANLYITPYTEQNPARRIELETCFIKNLQAGFDEIWLMVEEKDLDYTKELINRRYPTTAMINYRVIGTNRPAFQKYINQANHYEHDRIHCVMNGDILIEPEHLNKLKNLDWSKKLFVALSRWDQRESGNIILLDRADSADFWAFCGNCNVLDALCPLGVPGVDNSLAWKFKDAGYKVINPSRDIVTVHLHNVLGNNYRENGTGPVKAEMICPPPYEYHPPIFINQI